MWDVTGAAFSAADEGEPLWGLGGLVVVKLRASHTGDRFAVIEQRMRRACASPAHVHEHADETFMVIRGELALWIDGETVRAPAGSVAHVPGGLAHAWRVESDQADTIVVTTSEHEAFYRDCCDEAPGLVQPPDAGSVPMDRIRAAALRHGVSLLGGPWIEGAEPDVDGWR